MGPRKYTNEDAYQIPKRPNFASFIQTVLASSTGILDFDLNSDYCLLFSFFIMFPAALRVFSYCIHRDSNSQGQVIFPKSDTRYEPACVFIADSDFFRFLTTLMASDIFFG